MTDTAPKSSLSDEDKANVAFAIGAPPATGVLAAIDQIAADTGKGVDDLISLIRGPDCRAVFDAFHQLGHDAQAIVRAWHNVQPTLAAESTEGTTPSEEQGGEGG